MYRIKIIDIMPSNNLENFPFEIEKEYDLQNFIEQFSALSKNESYQEKVKFSIMLNNDDLLITALSLGEPINDVIQAIQDVSFLGAKNRKGKKYIKQLVKALKKSLQNGENTINSDVHAIEHNKKSKWKLFGVSLFVLVVGGVSFFSFGGMSLLPITSNEQVANDQNTTIGVFSTNQELNQLISEGKYEEAYKKYPEEVSTIEWAVYQLNDVAALTTFVNQHPSDNGKFDLAFATQKYSDVINTNNVTFTTDRLAMLGIAFLEKDKFTEAVNINTIVKSEMLTDKIKPKAQEYVRTYLSRRDFDNAKRMNTWTNAGLDELVTKAQTLQSLINQYQNTENTSQDNETKSIATKMKAIYEQALNELLKQ